MVAERARPLGRCDETHHAGGMGRAARRRKHHTSGAAAQCGGRQAIPLVHIGEMRHLITGQHGLSHLSRCFPDAHTSSTKLRLTACMV
ncbi:MAG: hypothetical protein IKT02_04310 [Bacteroidales bacterium]|nr:hypothetical protein [Bacteroidales bacterium]